MTRARFRLPCLVLLVLAGAAPAAARNGFGMLNKKVARLIRVSPPAVFLPGSRIDVQAHGSDAANVAVANRLQHELESELLSHDSRLRKDAVDPEIRVEVTVLQNEDQRSQERRIENQQRYAGKDARGKAVYRTVQVSVLYTTISSSFRASYEVTAVGSGASLDADSIPITFNRTYREGEAIPAPFVVENQAIDRVVARIVGRLVATRETVSVLLPRGELDDLAGLAQAGQWNRYLEVLEKRPPAPKPTDDAYRLYALGTAYEALGYAADEPEVTLRYLEKADSFYTQAIEANPREKLFVKAYDALLSAKSAEPPLDRVRAGLVAYRRVQELQAQARSLAETPAAGGPTSGEATGAKALDPAPGAKAEPGRMSNAEVIRMVQAGLPEEVILTAIEQAPSPAFDTSTDGLIQLARAKVTPRLIARLQQLSARKPGAKKSASPHR